MSKRFDSKENTDMLWEVLMDQPKYKSMTAGQMQYIAHQFNGYIRAFQNQEKIPSNMHDLNPVNRQFLLNFNALIFPPSAAAQQQPVSQQYRSDDFRAPVPQVPNFADKGDDPATLPDVTAMAAKLAAQRGFEQARTSAPVATTSATPAVQSRDAPDTSDIFAKMKRVDDHRREGSSSSSAHYEITPPESDRSSTATNISDVYRRLGRVEDKLDRILAKLGGERGERY